MTNPLPEAFYLPVNVDEFDSTPATTSPWDEAMQHGGPPAGLLARAIERTRADDDEASATMPIARLTIDMLGPIPQGRMRTEATIVRPGRRIELVEAKLWAGDRLAVTATAWRIRRDQGSTAAHAPAHTAHPLPEPQEPRFFPGGNPDWGYGRAVESRFVSGSFGEVGPANVWMRTRIPLVVGETTSPVQRLATVADSANGMSGELPLEEWTFIPPTMTLTIARPPAGDWVNLDVHTVLSPDGTGVTSGPIGDAHGYVGEVTQPLIVARR